MADFTVSSNQFAQVTMPGVACKMQVHDAPVCVTFTASGPTRGLILQPGDVIPIGAADAMRARRVGGLPAVLAFEVFG